MTYSEMNALVRGERLSVFHDGEWRKGTFNGFIPGADAAMWFAFDERQQQPGGMICTRVYTGMQFTEDYWNTEYPDTKFRRLSEEELNAEMLEKMEVIQ